ncbi:MAG: DUF1624 domain-containing protein [Clostridiales bacterium]|nr:DUF1624 domain-containing protein [Clostridiales bacterium]
MSGGRRLHWLDTLRGLCVLLMATFHFGYDLYFYCGFPAAFVASPFMVACQVISSWGFILLSGVSSRLSESNIKRGLVVLCGGAVVSVVTWFWGDFIRFGILQFLGCAMVLYGLTNRLWERLPRPLAPLLYLLLFFLTLRALPRVMDLPYFYPFGFVTPDFRSADYYPIFPWFFLFLFGTWLGLYIKAGRTPRPLGMVRVRPLAFLGRHAFAAYFIHQPLLLGLSWILAWATGHTPPF